MAANADQEVVKAAGDAHSRRCPGRLPRCLPRAAAAAAGGEHHEQGGGHGGSSRGGPPGIGPERSRSHGRQRGGSGGPARRGLRLAAPRAVTRVAPSRAAGLALSRGHRHLDRVHALPFVRSSIRSHGNDDKPRRYLPLRHQWSQNWIVFAPEFRSGTPRCPSAGQSVNRHESRRTARSLAHALRIGAGRARSGAADGHPRPRPRPRRRPHPRPRPGAFSVVALPARV